MTPSVAISIRQKEARFFQQKKSRYLMPVKNAYLKGGWLGGVRAGGSFVNNLYLGQPSCPAGGVVVYSR